MQNDAPREDDMPALTDTRRVVRLSMMVDEIRHIAKAYRTNDLADIRHQITGIEFFICGGKASVGTDNKSLYRQLVLAKRDAKAFVQRNAFPNSVAVKKASTLYKFYDSDDEDVEGESTSPLSRKDAHSMRRIAFVLKRFRSFMRTHQQQLDSDAGREAFFKLRLSKDEFVECGGHRTVSGKKDHSFYLQIVLAKRDMELILSRGSFRRTTKRRSEGVDYMSSDLEGDGEDVDGLDGDVDPLGECADNLDEIDDDASEELYGEEESE